VADNGGRIRPQVSIVKALASALCIGTGGSVGREGQPPTPLPGYEVIEIAISAGSPAAGHKLRDVAWPPGSTPVSVLRGRQLRAAEPGLALAKGDRVNLLAPLPGGSGGGPQR
jgi:TrkA-C domain